MERGGTDGLFVNTTGVGVVPASVALSASFARPDDVVLSSGTIGDHGVAVMTTRAGLELESRLESDAAPLYELASAILEAGGDGVRCMRDPTRGGIASTLNEIADASEVGIELDERSIPIRPEVEAACELLGLDPLYVANEGKVVAVVAPDVADAVLAAMRSNSLGRQAAIVGRVKHGRWVELQTTLGTSRIVDMLPGDQLPRIC